MKQLRLFLGLIVVILTFATNCPPTAKAQTDTPVPGCHVYKALIFNIQFSLDSQYLIANWPPHSVRLWNTETAQILATFTDDQINFEEKFALSADKKYLVTGGDAGVAILWDAKSGTKLQTLEEDGHVFVLAFSPNSKYIFILTDAKGSLWNVETGTKLFTFPGAYFEYPTAQFSPDGTKLIIENQLWDTETGKLLHDFGHGDMLFSPDGQYILVTMDDNTVLADAKTYRTVHILDRATSFWQFSPNGKYLLARNTNENAAIWNVEKGTLLREISAFMPAGLTIVNSFVENESVFLVKSSNEEPKKIIFSVYDIISGRELSAINFETSLLNIQSYAVAPNGKYFAVGVIDDYYSTVAAWDIRTGKQLHQYC